MTITKPLLTGLLGLYVAQGIPFGVAMFALPGIFRSQGSEMAEIGLLALIMLPWGIKFLWASWVDNHPIRFMHREGQSHYLSWIRICQWISTLGLALLLVTDPQAQFMLMLTVLLFVTLIQCTQDIAVDAVAVLISKHGKQDSLNANGIQIAGFSLGMLFGGSGALVAYEFSNWQGMVIYLLIALWLMYTPFYLFFNQWQQLPVVKVVSANRARLTDSLKRHAGWRLILIALLFKFGGGIGEALMAPLLVDQQLPLLWLSAVTGSSMMLAIAVAALVATRIGRYVSFEVMACCGLLVAAACWLILGTSLSFQNSPWVTTVLMVLEWLATNVACVAFFGIFMRWADPKQAGTDFTILQCNEAIGGVIGMSLGAQLAHHFGFGNTLLISGGVGVLISLLIFWLVQPERRRHAQLEETQKATQPDTLAEASR